MEREYGKIDTVIADAAFQRWMPLLEMQDSDWRDVINNKLNGTANMVRAFAPKIGAKKGRFILLSSVTQNEVRIGATRTSPPVYEYTA